MARGRFITFEGGEGTGKSTQVSLLADRLKARGVAVLVTREPGGSPGAEAVRHMLLSGAAKPLGPDVEAALFAAARGDHLEMTIRPAMKAGQWVISDRFADSTRIYQGAVGDADHDWISGLERITVGKTTPDLTIILDLPARIGLERARTRRGKSATDRFEAEAPEFHQKLREAYRNLATREPQRCVLIDARDGMLPVADRVWQAVMDRLGDHLQPQSLQKAAP